MTVIPRRRRAPAGVLVSCLLSAALVLAACGGSDNGGSSAGSSSSASSAKKYNMTLIAGVKGDEFYITMNCGAQAEAKKLGVSLNFQGPDKFAPDQQIPIVNAVAAKKPDAVLIAPTDTKALFAPITQLSDGGSKVVLVDTTLDQPGMAVSQISSDNEGGEPDDRSRRGPLANLHRVAPPWGHELLLRATHARYCVLLRS